MDMTYFEADMTYMKDAWETVKKIVKAFDEGHYTDKDGVLWTGIEAEDPKDDRWVRVNSTESMTSAEMQKKMRYEFMGWDEDPVVEDPYEYAIQRVSKDGQEEARIIGVFWSNREEVNESLLNLSTETVEYKVVKRRKAGPIQDV